MARILNYCQYSQ